MLVSRSVIWLSFTNVPLSTLLIALIYAVTRRLTGSRQIAMIAGFIAAIYPIFVLFSPILALVIWLKSKTWSKKLSTRAVA